MTVVEQGQFLPLCIFLTRAKLLQDQLNGYA